MPKIVTFILLAAFLTCCVSSQPLQIGSSTADIPSPDIHNANDSESNGTGSFTLMLKKKDYGLSITRLILDLGKNSVITDKEISENFFQVADINKSGKGTQNITGASVTDRQGYTVKSGRYVTVDLDFVMDPDSVTASFYIVTLNKDLGIFKEGTKFIQKGRTIRR